MFPIPNNLKIVKSVIQIEIIKPFFDEAKSKETIKNKKEKIHIKNAKITKPLFGSVK